jgi:hypothetical protein
MTYGYNLQDHCCLCGFSLNDTERNEKDNKLKFLFKQANQFRALKQGLTFLAIDAKHSRVGKFTNPLRF